MKRTSSKNLEVVDDSLDDNDNFSFLTHNVKKMLKKHGRFRKGWRYTQRNLRRKGESHLLWLQENRTFQIIMSRSRWKKSERSSIKGALCR